MTPVSYRLKIRVCFSLPKYNSLPLKIWQPPRSPMQWDDSTNAGFSSAPASDLYITMDPGKDRPTAKAQMADPDSLYHEVKKLIQIRQSSKALLSRGTIEFVYAEKNQYPLAYVREAEGEKVLVIINPSDKEQSFPYSAELKDA